MLFDRIDIYCERTDWGLWAEPLNALTNAAFFIAAVLILLSARRRGVSCRRVPSLLAGLVASVGAASLCFHLLAVQWASLLDSLTIEVFVLCFLWIYLRQILAVPRLTSGALILLLLVSTAAFVVFGAGLPLNGSEQYLSVWGAMLFLAFARQPREAKRHLFISAALFTLSIFFRSVDASVCSAFPFGSHFMWHVLNGAVCFCAAEAYLSTQKPNRC